MSNLISNLHLFCGVLYFIFGCLYLLQNIKKSINQIIFILFLLLALWSFGLYSISIEGLQPKFKELMFKLASIANFNFVNAGILSLIIYFEEIKFKNLKIIFGVVVFTLITHSLIQITANFNISDELLLLPTFSASINNGILKLFFSIYYYGTGFWLLYSLIEIIFQKRSYFKKEEALILIITVFLSFLFSFIHIYFQKYLHISVPNISNVYFFIFVFGLYYIGIQSQLNRNEFTDDPENIFDSIPNCLFYCDLNGNIKMVNSSTRRLFNNSYSGFLKMKMKDIFSNNYLNQYILLNYMKQNLINQEGEIILKNKTKVPVLFSNFILKSINNTSNGMICIVHDITERKKIEEALAEAQKDLELKVIERTDELIESNVELRARIEELEKENNKLFLKISHEESIKETEITLFNSITENLTNKINQFASDIEGDIIDKAEIKRFFAKASQSLKFIEEYINISSGTVKIKGKNEKFVIKEFFEGLINDFDLRIQHIPVSLKYSLNKNINNLIIYANKEIYMRVFKYLINNSLYYCTEGEIEIGTKKLDEAGYDWEFFIKDNRQIDLFFIGKDKESILDKVISWQLENNFDFGMELILAKELVTKLRGKIRLEFLSLDKGLSFNFSLPFQKV